MKLIKQIPNMLTLLNLVLGCVGILYAFDERYFLMLGSQHGVTETYEISNRLFTSGFCILLAAVIDFLDGFVARALNAKSEIGKQLDSLADMVTFGVLPTIIIYQLLERSYFMETIFDSDRYLIQREAYHFTSKLFMLPALLIACAACWRLAKFNIDERQHESFIGLPSPANAIFIASLPMIYIGNDYGLGNLLINKWVLYCLILILSWLMVSELKMFSMKVKSLGWRGNELRVIFILLALLMIFFLHWTGLALTIVLYILLSIINSFLTKPE